eukprot:TRINITY_DN24679_c0_g1_i1.p1 TRINITY_DN24679_c0_g1~~TRINITY_DN24679_c0_g1_i1.p1  ORF type:complete len:211 (-),score=35.97 TRINITY_DN24679_c0_g1_i1:224-856(-)
MPKSRAERMQAIRSMFAKLNKDGDKFLDLGEISRLLRKGNPEMSDQELAILFDNIDTNGDGKINFDEFVEYIFSKSGEKREDETKSKMRGPERFFYDKTTYTGTHIRGGPSTDDRPEANVRSPPLGERERPRPNLRAGDSDDEDAKPQRRGPLGLASPGKGGRSSFRGSSRGSGRRANDSDSDDNAPKRKLVGPERFFYDRSTYTGSHRQ